MLIYYKHKLIRGLLFMQQKMSQKELDVLKLIFDVKSPVTISDIVAKKPEEYTVNSIKHIIHKLCQLQMVKNEGFTCRGKAIARTFVPTETAYGVLQNIFEQEYLRYRELFTDNSLLLSLVKTEFSGNTSNEDLEKFENMLIDFKKQHDVGSK